MRNRLDKVLERDKIYSKAKQLIIIENKMDEEQKITAEPVGEEDGEKTYKCEKCGKVKKQSEGNFVLAGSSFCCLECCPKDDKKAEGGDDDHEHKEDDDGVCEFC